MATVDFDANDHEPSSGDDYQPIPAGWYIAHVVDSEVKETAKQGDPSKYLKLQIELIDNGKYDGRKVFDNCNLWNASQQARDIAQRQFSALCHAAGKLQVHDSEEIHHRKVEVKLTVRPAGERNGRHFNASNEVKGYRAVGSGKKDGKKETPTAPAGESKKESGGGGKAPWES
jgi:hypothetical protein